MRYTSVNKQTLPAFSYTLHVNLSMCPESLTLWVIYCYLENHPKLPGLKLLPFYFLPTLPSWLGPRGRSEADLAGGHPCSCAWLGAEARLLSLHTVGASRSYSMCLSMESPDKIAPAE